LQVFFYFLNLNKFLGVGFGVNCYCFNYLIDKNENIVNENLCNFYVCPGNENLFCGGNGTLFVYKTGIKGLWGDFKYFFV